MVIECCEFTFFRCKWIHTYLSFGNGKRRRRRQRKVARLLKLAWISLIFFPSIYRRKSLTPKAALARLLVTPKAAWLPAVRWFWTALLACRAELWARLVSSAPLADCPSSTLMAPPKSPPSPSNPCPLTATRVCWSGTTIFSLWMEPPAKTAVTGRITADYLSEEMWRRGRRMKMK